MCLGSALGSEQSRSLAKAAAPLLPAQARFATDRFVEGWQYGSGLDYTPPERPTPMDQQALATAKRAAAAARAFAATAPPPTSGPTAGSAQAVERV